MKTPQQTATKRRAQKAKLGQRTTSRRRKVSAAEMPMDYSAKAKLLMERSRSAFNEGSKYASAGASRLLKAAGKLDVPNNAHNAMDYAEQRPLIIGALGLGIGAAIGLMMPRTSARSAPKRRRA